MSSGSPSPHIVTFGCRLNIYESEVMRQRAQDAGLEDVVIVNTCTITAEADRQARQAIRKVRRERPQATIIVTGCAAQIDPQKFAAMPEVNHVIGNDLKTDATIFQTLKTGKAFEPHPSAHARPVPKFKGMERAFVEVQNGCNHACTFCIVPMGRGSSRSSPMGVIVDEVRAQVEAGYREIAFTGVDIASYGADLPGQPTLGQMARRVLSNVPDLRRLRLSSLDPAAMDEDVWRLMEDEPRLMPHLHLSVQAGDDIILKRMKRRHSAADVVRLCERARRLRPDVAFGADIIAGFPTEDDAMFANTQRLVEDCEITWLHVFPYSSRAKTPAARMPQVASPVRKARAAILRALGERAVARYLDGLVGRQLEVLVEGTKIGREPGFGEVILPFDAPVGELVPVVIMEREGGRAVGRLA